MSKRPQSPDLIPNPFIKKRNLTWTLDDSPPRHPHEDTHTSISHNGTEEKRPADTPSAAAIEAGEVNITNHLSHFTTLLTSHVLNTSPLSIKEYSNLYKSNVDSPNGAHFVIHQHDHPVAGTHYDL